MPKILTKSEVAEFPPEGLIVLAAAARKLLRKGPPLAIPATLPDYEGDTWEAQVDWQKKRVRVYHSKQTFSGDREQIVYEVDPADVLGVQVAAIRF